MMDARAYGLSLSVWFRLSLISAGLALILLTGGCAVYDDHHVFLQDQRPTSASTRPYRLAPPDVVMVLSSNIPPLHGQQQTISPDGKLHLPLMGSVHVAGKTCEEVSIELERLANAFHGNADIAVRVVAYESQKIYVFGEVARPGPYVYNGSNTLLGTLAQAQPTRLADPQRIHVLRPDAQGELISRMTVNLDDMIKRGETRHNAWLIEGDIIYVPANGLASVGLVLQQLLIPFQPSSTRPQPPATVIHNHYYMQPTMGSAEQVSPSGQ